MTELFTCVCGLPFKTREEIRKHIKECDKAEVETGLICSNCAVSTRILLPYGTSEVCPSCAILYEKPTIVLGSPLINHMDKKHEEIFRRKANALLQNLNVKTLSDMGITVALITFSKTPAPFRYMHSPRGEVIFVFSERKDIAEREEKTFEYVINHEIFHGYVIKLNLSITDVLMRPVSTLENWVGSLAEDIQLTKIAVNNEVKPLIRDEERRVEICYENIPVLSISTWKKLPDYMKFNSMVSVTYTHATELWLSRVLKDSHTRKQVKKNIRLVRRHYTAWGYPDLAELIQELYEQKIAKTKAEKRKMHEKILMCSDKWVEEQHLSIY